MPKEKKIEKLKKTKKDNFVKLAKRKNTKYKDRFRGDLYKNLHSFNKRG